MKLFKEVESTRKRRNTHHEISSVHRSSLLVPELDGLVAEISFINHFLLKRGIERVACKMTGLDSRGQRVATRTVSIDREVVYTFNLSAMHSVACASHMIEFYTADNLFVPFPAVMINHRGPRSLNMVHAYNRVLNDVFEDDEINVNQAKEASIDVQVTDNVDTCVVFASGPRPVRGVLEFQLISQREVLATKVNLDVPRLSHKVFTVSDLFGGKQCSRGILNVRQPPQFMFYGRMLCGMVDGDNAFVGNHSFYDSSESDERWENDVPSERVYPFLPHIENQVRMHPIVSPGELLVQVRVFGHDGRELAVGGLECLISPGKAVVSMSIDAIIESHSIDRAKVAAFAVKAYPPHAATPMRIGHQLVYGAGALEASINVSLYNINVFSPPGRTGIAWGQIPVGRDYESHLAFVWGHAAGEQADLDVAFYGRDGLITTSSFPLPPCGVVRFDTAKLPAAGEEAGTEYLWYVAKSLRPDLNAFSVVKHRDSQHCSGEHNF